MLTHAFTPEILKVLAKNFGESCAAQILHESPLLGYLNTKTKSASRGAKSRGSFANHYALYVVIEDYMPKSLKTRIANMKERDSPNCLQGKGSFHLAQNFKIML